MKREWIVEDAPDEAWISCIAETTEEAASLLLPMLGDGLTMKHDFGHEEEKPGLGRVDFFAVYDETGELVNHIFVRTPEHQEWVDSGRGKKQHPASLVYSAWPKEF